MMGVCSVTCRSPGCCATVPGIAVPLSDHPAWVDRLAFCEVVAIAQRELICVSVPSCSACSPLVKTLAPGVVVTKACLLRCRCRFRAGPGQASPITAGIVYWANGAPLRTQDAKSNAVFLYFRNEFNLAGAAVVSVLTTTQ